MKVNQAQFPVMKMCSLFGVSRSGYYSWINRPKSARAIEDEKLTEDILQFHKDSKETYGAPRIHADLADAGADIGKKRVASLMKAASIQGVSKKPYTVSTRSGEDAARPKDLVKRKFVAGRPNQLWVADITCIPTWAGFIYLAVVLDVFSRKIVAQRPWVGHWQEDENQIGAGCPQHGCAAKVPDQRHPPFRSGVAIYIYRLWCAMR